MNNKLEMAQSRFIEFISKICDDFGLNQFIAQLYAVLYLNDRPMSLDEIAEELGVSKGNVSLNIRELERWGAVRKLWVKGSRKDYDQTQQDIKGLILNKVKSGIRKRLDEAYRMIKEFNNILVSSNNGFNEEEKKVAKIYREKLKEIEKMINLGDKMLKVAGAIIPEK